LTNLGENDKTTSREVAIGNRGVIKQSNRAKIMKKIILLSASVLLASCNGGGKIKDIVDFTPKLIVEETNYKVALPEAAEAQAWKDGADWVNKQPHNFIAELGNKLSKHKVSKARMIAAPVMADGKIFTLSENGSLTATESSGGYKTLWSANLQSGSKAASFSSGGLAYKDGVLFLSNSTRDIIAFDAEVGRELWRRRLPDIARLQPVLYQNVAIIQTLNNQTYAINTDNGQILWQHDGIPETLVTNRNTAPIIYNGRVIVGYSSGQLVALNLANGQELWQLNLSREGDNLPDLTAVGFESQPVMDGSNLYIASGNGFLLKINMESGGLYWQRKVQDIQSMNIASNAVFVTTNAKQVAALSGVGGKVIWATDLDPIIDGKNKRRKPARLLTPVLVGGELIIVSSDGILRKLSPETGAITETLSIEKGAQYVTVSDSLNIFTNSNVLSSK